MVTGDHDLTATAIGRQIGLIPNDVNLFFIFVPFPSVPSQNGESPLIHCNIENLLGCYCNKAKKIIFDLNIN